MKRLFDIIFSLLLIVILSPVFIIVSLIIKFTSKGPVFFTQERVGKDNINFKLYKFRTMRIDTPNVATDLLANPDIYITRIGRFLRKSSIDELPQLFNILKGEMKFVGPRPALYNQYDLNEMRTRAGVHKLVPGVTGWAQINGRDHNDNFKKTELDKYYLNNESIALDIKILILTVFKVLRADGVIEGVRSNENVQEENKQKQTTSG